jgi:hypothetical protein
VLSRLLGDRVPPVDVEQVVHLPGEDTQFGSSSAQPPLRGFNKKQSAAHEVKTLANHITPSTHTAVQDELNSISSASTSPALRKRRPSPVIVRPQEFSASASSLLAATSPRVTSISIHMPVPPCMCTPITLVYRLFSCWAPRWTSSRWMWLVIPSLISMFVVWEMALLLGACVFMLWQMKITFHFERRHDTLHVDQMKSAALQASSGTENSDTKVSATKVPSRITTPQSLIQDSSSFPPPRAPASAAVSPVGRVRSFSTSDQSTLSTVSKLMSADLLARPSNSHSRNHHADWYRTPPSQGRARAASMIAADDSPRAQLHRHTSLDSMGPGAQTVSSLSLRTCASLLTSADEMDVQQSGYSLASMSQQVDVSHPFFQVRSCDAELYCIPL